MHASLFGVCLSLCAGVVLSLGEENKMRRKDFPQKIIPSNSEVTIKTGDGKEYRINQDLTPNPMISFYPSGETSGAIIAVNHPNGTYKVLVRTNGEVDRVEE